MARPNEHDALLFIAYGKPKDLAKWAEEHGWEPTAVEQIGTVNHPRHYRAMVAVLRGIAEAYVYEE